MINVCTDYGKIKRFESTCVCDQHVADEVTLILDAVIYNEMVKDSVGEKLGERELSAFVLEQRKAILALM